MEIRILFVALAVLALVAGVARGQQGKEKPRDWSWLAPGTTTREQVVDRMGPPAATFKRSQLRGRLEVEPRSEGEGAFGRRPRTGPESHVEVGVLSYPRVGDEVHDNVLVFRGDRLLYAVVRPGEHEEAVTDIEKKFGAPRTIRIEVTDGCEVETTLALVYAASRTAFLAAESASGCSECKRKIVWAGPADFAPDLEGVEWSLPEAPKPEK